MRMHRTTVVSKLCNNGAYISPQAPCTVQSEQSKQIMSRDINTVVSGDEDEVSFSTTYFFRYTFLRSSFSQGR